MEEKLLKRLQLIKKRPDLAKELSPTELADLVLVVLGYAKKIQKGVDSGALKGDPGKDAPIPQPDKDYLALPTAKKEIDSTLKKAVEQMKSDIQTKIENIRDGKDGEDAFITDTHIEHAAEIAAELIELPDFGALINAEPQAIRNALELLQGDDRLDKSSIKGLEEVLQEFSDRINNLKITSGQGVGKIPFAFLRDVDMEGVTDGQVPAYNATTGKYEPADNAGGVASALDDLTDVTLSSPSNGQVLKYNGSAWVNDTDATGSGGSATVLDLGDDGADESTDLTEIATTGDTNSIFTEPTADKLLIDVSNAWPTADALQGVTASSAELNILDGATLTTTELNYVDGVTSAIQTQLDAKQDQDDILDDLSGLTQASNKVPYFDSATTASVLDFLDEDTMTSDSATAVASQQSIKAYVDAQSGYTDEEAQDAVGTILVDSSEIDFTYTDATPSITASLVAGSIDETKLDTSVNASLDLADSALQSADIDTLAELNAIVGDATLVDASHTHTESDITDLGDYITASSTDTLTNKTLTAPKIADAGFIADANGNELIVMDTVASAVNELKVANAATGGAPEIAAQGGDTNIDIQLTPKGTGIVKGELKRFMVRLEDSATALAAATTKGGDYRIANRAITIKEVGCYVDTAAATGTTKLTVDIHEAGTTIMSTNKITIDVGEKTSETAATAPVISDTAIAADGIVTFDIDSVNETTPAKGLVVWIDYTF